MKRREAEAAKAKEMADQQLEEAAAEATRLHREAAERKASAEERLAAFEATQSAAQQEAASQQQKLQSLREALIDREDKLRAQEADLLAAKNSLEVCLAVYSLHVNALTMSAIKLKLTDVKCRYDLHF